MVWSLTALSPRRFLKPARRKPIRKAARLSLERLEDRLAPANVAITSAHYDYNLLGWNLYFP